MTTSAPLNSITGALVTTPAGTLAPGGAPRHLAPVILSLDAANYSASFLFSAVFVFQK
jgi:hypothetical protein